MTALQMHPCRLTVVAIPLLVAGALAGGVFRTSAAEAVPSAAATGAAAAAVGEDIWLRDCAICHGEDARGTERAPSLQGVGPAGVDFMVSTGRMPLDDPADEPRRGPVHYDPAEIAALVAHTETFVSGPSVPSVDLRDASVSTGGQLYRTNCASCHQMAGQGGILTSGRNVPPLGSVSPTQTVEALRTGPSDMPSFPSDLIDDDAAADVAAYVRELQDPRDPGGWALGHWGPVPEGAVAFVLGVIPLVVIARWLGDRNPAPRHPDERA